MGWEGDAGGNPAASQLCKGMCWGRAGTDTHVLMGWWTHRQPKGSLTHSSSVCLYEGGHVLRDVSAQAGPSPAHRISFCSISLQQWQEGPPRSLVMVGAWSGKLPANPPIGAHPQDEAVWLSPDTRTSKQYSGVSSLCKGHAWISLGQSGPQ